MTDKDVDTLSAGPRTTIVGLAFTDAELRDLARDGLGFRPHVVIALLDRIATLEARTSAPEELLREVRERHHVRRCSCGGRRWAADENWQGDGHTIRTRGDGLIPCGLCNLGGWETAEFEVDERCDEDDMPWPCDVSRLLATTVAGALDAATERLRRPGQPGLWCPTCGDRIDPIPDEDGAL